MKLIVSFYGMCLCVLDGRAGNRAKKATVLLLNGTAPSTKASGGVPLPFHHPLLFVPARQADLKHSDWSPVPAPDTLVDTENLVSVKSHAWSVSGLDLTLGQGKGITMFENQTADASGRLPDPSRLSDAQAWLDWRRIPDLSRIARGATLRASYRKIGVNVLARVHFTGGELRGATPKDPGGVATPWHFSDGFSQVITDRFEFHCELPGRTLNAAGYAGTRRQAIRLSEPDAKVIRLSIVHEATPLAFVRPAAGARTSRAAKGSAVELPHYTAFYQAISGGTVDALGAPRAGKPFAPSVKRPVIDSPACPPALI
jgi:hypothetical protein